MRQGGLPDRQLASLKEFFPKLRDRLPPERRIPDASRLFEAMDLDGSGELELDEFADAFRRVSQAL